MSDATYGRNGTYVIGRLGQLVIKTPRALMFVSSIQATPRSSRRMCDVSIAVMDGAEVVDFLYKLHNAQSGSSRPLSTRQHHNVKITAIGVTVGCLNCVLSHQPLNFARSLPYIAAARVAERGRRDQHDLENVKGIAS